MNLQQRIEYLSRSIMCAKSSSTRTSSAVEGEFLHELEEKMEVRNGAASFYDLSLFYALYGEPSD